MARATCFRCDWTGEAAGIACPSCGTPVYRTSSAPARAPEEASSAPADRAARVAPPATYLSRADLDGQQPPLPRRVHRFWAFVLLAVLLTGSVWWFLRAHEIPNAEGAVAPTSHTGPTVWLLG